MIIVRVWWINGACDEYKARTARDAERMLNNAYKNPDVVSVEIDYD